MATIFAIFTYEMGIFSCVPLVKITFDDNCYRLRINFRACYPDVPGISSIFSLKIKILSINYFLFSKLVSLRIKIIRRYEDLKNKNHFAKSRSSEFQNGRHHKKNFLLVVLLIDQHF